mgnify:CR=1 FL=1
MKVHVQLFGAMRDLAEGRDAFFVLEDGACLGELLDEMEKRYPRLMKRLRPSLMTGYAAALVDGKNAATGEGLETHLVDDSTVVFLPPVAGG